MDMLSVPSGNLPHDVLWYVNLLFSCHFVIFCFFCVLGGRRGVSERCDCRATGRSSRQKQSRNPHNHHLSG